MNNKLKKLFMKEGSNTEREFVNELNFADVYYKKVEVLNYTGHEFDILKRYPRENNRPIIYRVTIPVQRSLGGHALSVSPYAKTPAKHLIPDEVKEGVYFVVTAEVKEKFFKGRQDVVVPTGFVEEGDVYGIAALTF